MHVINHGTESVKVNGVTQDSRKVQKDYMFIAIQGAHSDGHQFIRQAIDLGASVLVVQDPEKVPKSFTGKIWQVEDTRTFLDSAVSEFWGNPSHDMIVVGVTGTNGKTTTTQIIEHVLNEQGFPTGVIGTIDHHLGKHVFETEQTTPGPEELQERLHTFKKLGAKAVSMEVSSHALIQKRVDSLWFDVCVFTNLTRDHLDYHGDMGSYFRAKELLFDTLLWKSLKPNRTAVINNDDEYGKQLRVAPRCKKITYGTKSADILVKIKTETFDGTQVVFSYKRKDYLVNSRLIGRFNVMNLAAAFGTAVALGGDLWKAATSLSEYPGAKGRLQKVPNPKGVHVFVDYAHTDDALMNVLTTLYNLRSAIQASNVKIITVFGCGGDRDKGKRPMMAKAAEAHSDHVIVTSDNPRSEKAEDIIEDIKKGFSPEFLKANVTCKTSRRDGIAAAFEIARTGDIVLIAGKGHEEYQIIGTTRSSFSDVGVVREILGT